LRTKTELHPGKIISNIIIL